VQTFLAVVKAIFFALPGIVAFLVAAAALAVFYMEELQTTLREKKLIRWTVAIVLMLMGMGAFAADKMQKTQEREEREQAIKDTARDVAAETSKQVTKAVTEQYSQMISEQKQEITALRSQLSAQGKDVLAIKSSNIVTGKGPVKVELTNPNNNSGQSSWSLSPEKVEALYGGVKTTTAQFMIIAALDDNQSYRLALQIHSILIRAGWTSAETQPSRGPWVGRFQGVAIKVSHPDFQAAKDLQDAFKYLGLNAAGQIDKDVPNNIVEIDVGYKPDYWKD
jgi:hypothetical protein